MTKVYWDGNEEGYLVLDGKYAKHDDAENVLLSNRPDGRLGTVKKIIFKIDNSVHEHLARAENNRFGQGIY
jgi:hypothetical protein